MNHFQPVIVLQPDLVPLLSRCDLPIMLYRDTVALKLQFFNKILQRGGHFQSFKDSRMAVQDERKWHRDKVTGLCAPQAAA